MSEDLYDRQLFEAGIDEHGDLHVRVYYSPTRTTRQSDAGLVMDRRHATALRRILDCYLGQPTPPAQYLYEHAMDADESLDLLIRHYMFGWALVRNAYTISRAPASLVDRAKASELLRSALDAFLRDAPKQLDKIRRRLLAPDGELIEAAKARVKREFEEAQK